MHMDGHEDDDKYIVLMMKAVDGLLNDDETKEWEHHLAHNPQCAREFAQFSGTARYLDDFRERKLYEHHARNARQPNKVLMWTGFGLLLLGLGIVWFFALDPMLAGSASSGGIIAGVGITVAGFALLAVKLVRATFRDA